MIWGIKEGGKVLVGRSMIDVAVSSTPCYPIENSYIRKYLLSINNIIL